MNFSSPTCGIVSHVGGQGSVGSIWHLVRGLCCRIPTVQYSTVQLCGESQRIKGGFEAFHGLLDRHWVYLFFAFRHARGSNTRRLLAVGALNGWTIVSTHEK